MHLIYIMSAVCTFCVANIYYSQPILMLLAEAFGAGPEQIGNIPTIVQFAYAAGLLFLVPLGDRVNRKRLLQILLGINMAASLVIAQTASFLMLELMNFFVGITSIGAQIIIPSAPAYVPKEQRGRAIGILFSGLVSGILFARLFSGYVGALWGWQAVFYAAAGLDIGILLFIGMKFPRNEGLAELHYGELLYSIGRLLAGERELRRSCVSGFLIFGGYSAIWGSMAYLTSLPPFFLTSDEVGLVGLSGIAGIIASPYVGREADAFSPRFAVAVGGVISLLGFVLLYFSTAGIVMLILAMLVLDLSTRHSVIGNQLRAFALNEQARSRLNTAFMTSYFLGGACGTKAGVLLGSIWGWAGLAGLGVLLSFVTIWLNRQGFRDAIR